MSKYLFKTKCLACGAFEITSWCHDKEKCGGVYYIDEDLYLHCNKCNYKTFLLDLTFNCGKHDYRKPKFRYFSHALSILRETSDLPDDILEKMFDKASHFIHIIG